MRGKTRFLFLALLLTLALSACGKGREVQDADDLISAIGQVTLQSESRISAAEQAVSALSAEDREQLEGTDVLTAARSAYDALVREAALKEEAANVEDAINAIGEVTLDSGKAIEAAHRAYDAASGGARLQVTNAALLDEADNALLVLQAAPVEEAIEAIGEVTLESGEAIDAARKAFDGVEPEVQASVRNAGALDAAAETLTNLRAAQVEELISAIGEVTLDSAGAVKAAQDAYDALSQEEAAKVPNSGDLDAAAERLSALKKEQGQAMLSNFYHQHDQVTNIDWYYPKAYPYYTADNLWGVDIRTFVLPYMGQDAKGNIWLRLVCHYYGDDWIFFDHVIFSIDGENQQKTFKRSEINRDHSGGYVWETADIACETSERELLWNVVNSTQTITRFEGSHIFDLTVSDTDKAAIRDVLTCFEDLTSE